MYTCIHILLHIHIHIYYIYCPAGGGVPVDGLGGGILRVHALEYVTGAAENEERWSWLMQTTSGLLYHSNLAHSLFKSSQNDRGKEGVQGLLEVIWVPLEQSLAPSAFGRQGGIHSASCMREIAGLLVTPPGGGDGGVEGVGGVCVMHSEGYYSVYSDKSLGLIDFDSSARGFVGLGTNSALQVFGFPRSSSPPAITPPTASPPHTHVACSSAQGDVAAVVLNDGQVVTARFGPLPLHPEVQVCVVVWCSVLQSVAGLCCVV